MDRLFAILPPIFVGGRPKCQTRTGFFLQTRKSRLTHGCNRRDAGVISYPAHFPQTGVVLEGADKCGEGGDGEVRHGDGCGVFPAYHNQRHDPPIVGLITKR